jgi:hypothetical protein
MKSLHFTRGVYSGNWSWQPCDISDLCDDPPLQRHPFFPSRIADPLLNEFITPKQVLNVLNEPGLPSCCSCSATC